MPEQEERLERRSVERRTKFNEEKRTNWQITISYS